MRKGGDVCFSQVYRDARGNKCAHIILSIENQVEWF